LKKFGLINLWLKNLIIKPADKGSATVLINRADYIKEAYRQLNNDKYYIKLDPSVNLGSNNKIKNVLVNMLKDNFISDKQFNYLTGPSEFRKRNFYLLPKIHKDKNKWPSEKMPEGRPIVSDININIYINKRFDLKCFLFRWEPQNTPENHNEG